METVSENPKVAMWNKIWIVKISDVGDEFKEWLHGQTMPLVSEDETPYDWAYFSDFSRFMNKIPVTD